MRKINFNQTMISFNKNKQTRNIKNNQSNNIDRHLHALRNIYKNMEITRNFQKNRTNINRN